MWPAKEGHRCRSPSIVLFPDARLRRCFLLLEEVCVVQEAVHTERLLGFVVMWREHEEGRDRADKTEHAGDGERKREVFQVTQPTTEEATLMLLCTGWHVC